MATTPQLAAEYFGVQDKPRRTVMMWPDRCLLVFRAGDRVVVASYARDSRMERAWIAMTERQADQLVSALKGV